MIAETSSNVRADRSRRHDRVGSEDRRLVAVRGGGERRPVEGLGHARTARAVGGEVPQGRARRPRPHRVLGEHAGLQRHERRELQRAGGGAVALVGDRRVDRRTHAAGAAGERHPVDAALAPTTRPSSGSWARRAERRRAPVDRSTPNSWLRPFESSSTCTVAASVRLPATTGTSVVVGATVVDGAVVGPAWWERAWSASTGSGPRSPRRRSWRRRARRPHRSRPPACATAAAPTTAAAAG